VSSLETALGDTAAVRRIVNDTQRISNDIDRLRMDLADLGPADAAILSPQPEEKIQIPDVDYAVDFWRDVDHEGVGAQSLACVRRPA